MQAHMYNTHTHHTTQTHMFVTQALERERVVGRGVH